MRPKSENKNETTGLQFLSSLRFRLSLLVQHIVCPVLYCCTNYRRLKHKLFFLDQRSAGPPGWCPLFGRQTGPLLTQLRPLKFHSFDDSMYIYICISNIPHLKHGSSIIKHFKCITFRTLQLLVPKLRTEESLTTTEHPAVSSHTRQKGDPPPQKKNTFWASQAGKQI